MSADDNRMTAWQFLRWFAANQNRTQLALEAVSETICIVFVATFPLSWPLPVWAKVAAGVVLVVLAQACLWLALGSPRVQKWITGTAGESK